MTSNSTACLDGWSSDNILRVPMDIGPFSEPWNTDCYFHLLGLQGLLGFYIIVYLPCGILVWGELQRGKIKKKHDSSSSSAPAVPTLLKAMYYIVLIMIVEAMISFVISLLDPQYIPVIYVIQNVSMFIGIFVFYLHIISSEAKIVTNYTRKKSLMAIYGKSVTIFAVICLTLCFISIIIGCIGMSFYLVEQQEPELALVYYRVYCFGWTFTVFTFVSHFRFTMSKFANFVEEIMQNAAPLQRTPQPTTPDHQNQQRLATVATDTMKNQNSSSSNGSHPHGGGATSSCAKGDKLNEVITRFREFRRNILLITPGGVALFLMQGLFLPMFTLFVMPIQLYNALLAIYIFLFVSIPKDRRTSHFRFQPFIEKLTGKSSRVTSNQQDGQQEQGDHEEAHIGATSDVKSAASSTGNPAVVAAGAIIPVHDDHV